MKDLENARKLTSLLEEEYLALRKAKVDEKGQNGDSNTNGDAPQEDASMGDSTGDVEDDPEPREMGSEAVERRIEKVMADLQEQGAVDTSDERALEAKRVRVGSRFCVCSNAEHGLLADGDSFGSVPRLSSSSVQHVLLLRSYCRPSGGVAAEVY